MSILIEFNSIMSAMQYYLNLKGRLVWFALIF
nr:MAG TPA: hypothetical protein [Bacteriophage sp.]